ncbi:ssDNA binding protein [Microbacterium phage Hannabella]|uniref:Uncharacterized protein n=1 Tax=Microbacterium phage Arete TaxID=2713257 RepID=A0A6G8R1Q8_9CAUD|nr:hypothetical protein HWD16_gp15 [Microbacterium phage Arete]QIN93898.1 hypothetical protein SEA_ARETE_15 [Microbacterium phage Arete]URM86410.1 hypothetical protein SEA_GSHELBY23_13 [Microbacterium phage Gshelby23]UVG34221.1 ssDNA binding protein [Microbacterium phage Hannabella]
MAAATKNPKQVTIKGRLSFPRFTHKEAVAANDKSKFKKADPNEVSSEFNLLIEQDQLDKLKDHILNVMIPYIEEQNAKKEKRDSLSPKLIQKIKDKIASEDWDGSPFLPMKPVSEKNLESAPESVASVKITGPKGADITLKARVEDESQLVIPDPDILSWPTIVSLDKSVFSMYAGAYVAATLNLFAFESSSTINGISAGANTAVYLGNLEGARFGGGVDVDEDDIFMD